MILEKTLDYLKGLFTEEYPNKKYNDSMKKLLSKLNDQKLKLEVQLENEINEEKRKDIELRLKIISKHKKKGVKLMQERETYSPSSRNHKVIIKPELSPPIL